MNHGDHAKKHGHVAVTMACHVFPTENFFPLELILVICSWINYCMKSFIFIPKITQKCAKRIDFFKSDVENMNKIKQI